MNVTQHQKTVVHNLQLPAEIRETFVQWLNKFNDQETTKLSADANMLGYYLIGLHTSCAILVCAYNYFRGVFDIWDFVVYAFIPGICLTYLIQLVNRVGQKLLEKRTKKKIKNDPFYKAVYTVFSAIETYNSRLFVLENTWDDLLQNERDYLIDYLKGRRREIIEVSGDFLAKIKGGDMSEGDFQSLHYHTQALKSLDGFAQKEDLDDFDRRLKMEITESNVTLPVDQQSEVIEEEMVIKNH